MHCGEPNCICDKAGKWRNSWPACHCEDAVNGEDNQVIVRWKHVATPAGEPEPVLNSKDSSGCSGDEAGAAIARHEMRSAVPCPLVEQLSPQSGSHYVWQG